MFANGKIVAYPTDTSYGLGVRADDEEMLDRLYEIKKRPVTKFTSLMVKDWQMLNEYAEVPEILTEKFFTASPRTVILKPKESLPKSPFWPDHAVGFRIATRPAVASAINYPVTATSANLSGQSNIYDPSKIVGEWGSEILIFSESPVLDDSISPSEIWDYTVPNKPKRIR
ncbi:Sua5/YciO/YrdC/YwlC family protein [bacterium]|nr:Sua5/YciO/YrdC/YwlC family protein [bacterium]NCQ55898.1 Sua5/YciO/YrdC/YwlC family protein [Candidatus Parcubacteria bacterium]NCS67606.1 Sua5/YciO/YrdC/YwlC family protein [Candidatus Peregrinibacteria bacterium]NCS96229.1 Sua5/YciO/YrdC/YwlC family protein [bacterium]